METPPKNLYPVLDYLNLLSKVSTLETCVFEKESISIIFRPVWFITVLFTQLPWKNSMQVLTKNLFRFMKLLISINPLLFYPNFLFWNILVSIGNISFENVLNSPYISTCNQIYLYAPFLPLCSKFSELNSVPI